MKVSFKRDVYIIVAVIVILAVSLQLVRSQYVLQFVSNGNLTEDRPAGPSTVKLADANELPGPAYCVLYHSQDDSSTMVKNNVTRMLQYMKKKSVEIDTSSGDAVHFDSCKAVIITNHQLDSIQNMDSIADYVENGGYAMFTSQLVPDQTFYNLYRKMGMVSMGGSDMAYGIELDSNVLIGEQGFESDDPYFTNYSNLVEIDDESELLASSGDGIPLLWKREFGQGAFVVFNGTMLQEKINRGLFAGAFSLLEPEFIYPVFNTKLVYIDDFPAPIGEGSKPVIYDAYHKDIRQFYREIWWPDMLKAAQRSGIKYTAGVIQSYQNQVKPPFESPQDGDRFNLISYGREVIKSGGEVGIHGYNHQSLQTDSRIADFYGYKVWGSQADMEQAVTEVLRFTKKAFPNYQVTSYIPPSNMIDATGREALKQVWPELTVITSLYVEDSNNVSYVQEFEIAEDGILEMPRITSGYVATSFEQWSEANAITSLGVYSRFIHPDDILDDLRGKNMTWAQMYEGFSTILDRLQHDYPWLRAMTATEAAIDMEQVLGAQVQFTHLPNSIQGEISGLNSDQCFILRTERKIGSLKGCAVREIDDNVYLVTVNDVHFEIGLED